MFGVEVGGTGRKRLFLLEFSSLGIRSSQKGGIIGSGPRKCLQPLLGEDPFQIGNDLAAKCPLSDGLHIPLHQTNIKCFQPLPRIFYYCFTGLQRVLR